jgi:hypothetical protein
MQTFPRSLILAFLAAMIGSLLLLAACGDDDDGGDDDVSPTASGPTPTIPYDLLPVGYPQDFPLYPGATIGQTARYENQVHVTTESDTPGEVIANFYREIVREAPWQPLLETLDDTRGVIVIRFQNPDEGITGNVTVTSTTGSLQEDRSNVSYVFVLSEPAGSPGAATTAATPAATPTP